MTTLEELKELVQEAKEFKTSKYNISHYARHLVKLGILKESQKFIESNKTSGLVSDEILELLKSIFFSIHSLTAITKTSFLLDSKRFYPKENKNLIKKGTDLTQSYLTSVFINNNKIVVCNCKEGWSMVGTYTYINTTWDHLAFIIKELIKEEENGVK